MPRPRLPTVSWTRYWTAVRTSRSRPPEPSFPLPYFHPGRALPGGGWRLPACDILDSDPFHQGIPSMTEDRQGRSGDSSKILYCSFCGKSQHEVRKLIAGPSVFICDECVELCNDIIREELEEK